MQLQSHVCLAVVMFVIWVFVEPCHHGNLMFVMVFSTAPHPSCGLYSPAQTCIHLVVLYSPGGTLNSPGYTVQSRIRLHSTLNAQPVQHCTALHTAHTALLSGLIKSKSNSRKCRSHPILCAKVLFLFSESHYYCCILMRWSQGCLVQ